MIEIKELEKLAELRDKGIISQEQFEEKKKNILNGTEVRDKSPVSPFGYYIGCWKKSFQYSGRSTRSEYWYFYLFNYLIGYCLSFFIPFLAVSNSKFILSHYYTAYFLITLLPSLAVQVRRYHDIGKSGWFALIPRVLLTTPFIVCFLVNPLAAVFPFVLILSQDVNAFAIYFFLLSPVLYGFYEIIWWLIFPSLPPQKGDNKYGPQP